ncbi:hypothetical protein ACC674_39600, partial [Rhizobium ruizarguesonis]
MIIKTIAARRTVSGNTIGGGRKAISRKRKVPAIAVRYGSTPRADLIYRHDVCRDLKENAPST